MQDEEDLLAAGCAAYVVLLAAHARGLAGYWRTPAVLRDPAGRAALGVEPDDEHAVGLLHLGPPRQEQRVPERAPVADVVALPGLTPAGRPPVPAQQLVRGQREDRRRRARRRPDLVGKPSRSSSTSVSTGAVTQP